MTERNHSKRNGGGFLGRRRVVLTAVVVGSFVVLAHVVAAIWFGMAMSDFIGGAAIGLILVIVGLAHLLLPGHARSKVINMNRQLLSWLVTVLVGFVVGLLAVLLVPWISWGVLVLGAVGAVGIGRMLDGSPRAKAARLGAFGFLAGITYLGFHPSQEAVSPPSLVSALGIALFCGAMAILVGLITHLTIGPMKPRASDSPL